MSDATPFDPAALGALIDGIEGTGAPPELVGQLRGLVRDEDERRKVFEKQRAIPRARLSYTSALCTLTSPFAGPWPANLGLPADRPAVNPVRWLPDSWGPLPIIVEDLVAALDESPARDDPPPTTADGPPDPAA